MSHKRPVDSLSLTHYRNHEATWFDCDFWRTDWTHLGWQAQYAWIRLLSGPEYGQHGFPIDQLTKALDSREVDAEAAVESLLRAGLITERHGYYVFPNVVWGAPPEEAVL